MTTPYMGQPGGSGPYPLPGLPAAPAPVYPLQLLATTQTLNPNGFALQNGTPQIFQWLVPGDGNLHRFLLFGNLDVTSAQTGGALTVSYTLPPASAASFAFFAGSLAAGQNTNSGFHVVPPGTTVTLAQSSAQTAGAAVLFAELWGY